MAKAAQKQLLALLKTFPSFGDYSNLVITCRNDTHKVHETIVCSRFEFFAKPLSFGGKEAEEVKIELPSDEPPIVKLLVQYLYEADYDPTSPTTSSVLVKQTSNSISPTISSKFGKSKYNNMDFDHATNVFPHHICGRHCNYDCTQFVCHRCLPSIRCSAEELATHDKMYEVTDKYNVVGLKGLAKEKFELACQSFWNDANFPIAANHTLCAAPDNDKGLHDILCKTTPKHTSPPKKPEIEAIMTESNRLAFDLLKEKASQYGWMNKQASSLEHRNVTSPGQFHSSANI